MTPDSNDPFGSPVTASDGIHDTRRDRRLDPHGRLPPAAGRSLRDRYGRMAPVGRGGQPPVGAGWPAPPRGVGVVTTLPVDRDGELRMGSMADGRITVFLADDNVIVREGVGRCSRSRPTSSRRRPPTTTTSSSPAPTAAAPQVLVTDIRMPPSFQQEGIDAAKELRKRHPGTGVVVLSQYDDPEYAVALLADGAAGLRVPPQGPRRRGRPARAGRARGRDRRLGARPEDRRGARAPVTDDGGLTADDEQLLHEVAEGRPIKAIATEEQRRIGRQAPERSLAGRSD